MKNLFAVIILALIFNSCVALDVATIFIESKPVHYAEVQSITKSKDKTTLFFVDGYNYEVAGSVYAQPGDKIKIFQQEDGTFTAESD